MKLWQPDITPHILKYQLHKEVMIGHYFLTAADLDTHVCDDGCEEHQNNRPI